MKLPQHSFAHQAADVDLPAWEKLAEPPMRVWVKGKVREIPPVTIGNAILWERALSGDKDAERELEKPGALYRAFLGDLLDELIADGVSAAAVDRVFGTAFQDYTFDRLTAYGFWNLGARSELHQQFIDITNRMYEESQQEDAEAS